MNIQNLFFVSAGIIAVGFAITAYFLFDFNRKWKKMFGNSGDSQDALAKLLQETGDIKTILEKDEARLKVLEAISQISVQKIGFLRFNPFSETGGENSFSLTILDRNNNGIIISSLYTREGGRVYGKSVEKGTPKYPLSEEEQASLEQAMGTIEAPIKKKKKNDE